MNVQATNRDSIASATVKQSAIEAIQGLPDDCTWEDVQYQIYVRQKIQEGLDDIEAGRVVAEAEVFAAFR